MDHFKINTKIKMNQTEDIKEADWRSTQKKHYLQHKESGDYH